MMLSSARELKSTLIESVLTPLDVTPARRAAFGMAARSVSTTRSQPSEALALGIAPTGNGEFQLAVRVQQRSMVDSREVDLIRRKAKNEAQVRYIGRAVKRAIPWYQRRQRPLKIGCSIGHYKITAGTLGCFVCREGEETPLLLSNNHVLANENRANSGDVILQQGAFDGGHNPTDGVAQLADFVKLKKRGINYVDCAVASVKDRLKFDQRHVKGLGNLAGIRNSLLEEGTKVCKVGRTTGKTIGRVTAFELDRLVVDFELGRLRFDDQIEIEGDGGIFSDGGDSGSLILDADRRAVALLFAGTELGGENSMGLTYANPRPAVFNALKVELLS